MFNYVCKCMHMCMWGTMKQRCLVFFRGTRIFLLCRVFQFRRKESIQDFNNEEIGVQFTWYLESSVLSSHNMCQQSASIKVAIFNTVVPLKRKQIKLGCYINAFCTISSYFLRDQPEKSKIIPADVLKPLFYFSAFSPLACVDVSQKFVFWKEGESGQSHANECVTQSVVGGKVKY